MLKAIGDGELGDLTDLYAWMSADGAKLELVLGWAPDVAATSGFSDEVQWAFHVSSRAAFGGAGGATSGAEAKAICTFDVEQRVSCWLGEVYVHGDASGASGLTSADGRLRVFAGRRDDPFFMNQAGFRAAAPTIAAQVAEGDTDAAGCPMIESGDAAGIAQQLAHGAALAAPSDDLAGQDDLVLALEIDKSLVDTGGPVLGVWASTHDAQEVTP